MKASFALILFLLLTNIPTNAQQGWFWQNPLHQGNDLYDVHILNFNTAIAIGSVGTVLKTTDGGTNWFALSSGVLGSLESVHFIDDNTGWAVGGEHGNGPGIVLKTTDGGETWYSQAIGTSVHLYSVHFTDNNTGWAVGFDGLILKTTNGGENWDSQTSGTTGWLFSVHFTDNNTGWAVGLDGIILKTTDGGTNWTFQANVTQYTLFSVHFMDNNTGWVIGSGVTILKTTDGGENWNSQTSGTPNWLISVHFTDNNTGLAVGDHGTILKTTNGGVTFIDDESNFTKPKNYLLSQNYTNPFNPSTTIRFTISDFPAGSGTGRFTILKVYDVLGNKITTLVNEESATGGAGSYEVEFSAIGGSASGGDAYTLPSGIYFYQLRVVDPESSSGQGFVETKKMLLIK